MEAKPILNCEEGNDSTGVNSDDKLVDINYPDLTECRKIIKRLTLLDLDEMSSQKVSELLIIEDSRDKLHQVIQKQEKDLEALEKALDEQRKQFTKLQIVHTKLLKDIEIEKLTGVQKPSVPLSISRSVGIQPRIQLNVSTKKEANESSSPQVLSCSRQKQALKKQKRMAKRLTCDLNKDPAEAVKKPGAPGKADAII